MDPDTIASRGNYHAHEHISRTHESLFFSQASTRHERLSALQPVQASFWTLRETRGAVPGFDFYGNPTQCPMIALDPKQKQEWPQTKAMLKGLMDLRASSDHQKARTDRQYLSGAHSRRGGT